MLELTRVFDGGNPFVTLEEDQKTFIDMLYGKEGYSKQKGSVVICKKIGGRLKQYQWVNVNDYNSLEVALNKQIGEKDVYININPMWNFKSRTKENIHQYKFLYQDLDIEAARESGLLKLTTNQIILVIEDLSKNMTIPYPTMIINSGRGLHLYWSIGDCPNTKIIRKYWEDIQKQLYEVLKPYGADRAIITDGARILRVPSTLNGKNNAECYIVEYNKSCTYTLNDIRDKYFKSALDKELQQKKDKIEKRKKKAEIVKDKNVIDLAKTKTPYTLHKARMEDLIKLIKIRGGNISAGGEGRRNIILLQIGYYYALTHKRATPEEVREFVEGVNELFNEELPAKEVKAIVKHSLKYAAKKLGSGTKEMEKISDLKNVRLYQYSVTIDDTTTGLNYNNSTLLDLYEITSEEMQQLKTLIDSTEKNERKKASNKASRRNGEELTPKQREQLQKRKKVIALLEQGLSKRKAANEMGISLSTLQNLIK